MAPEQLLDPRQTEAPDSAKAADKQAEKEASQQAAAPAPAEPAAVDPVAEIERLGALHEKGLLSDEEFAAAKAKLLGL